MARKRTGIRNRYRRGCVLSTYSRKHKGRAADAYGEFHEGRRVSPDRIRLDVRAVDTVTEEGT